jgi:hypothetical protein
MRKLVISSCITIIRGSKMDKVWEGIDQASRFEIETRYQELSFAVGRAMAKNRADYALQGVEFYNRCAAIMCKMISDEMKKAVK